MHLASVNSVIVAIGSWVCAILSLIILILAVRNRP